MAEEGIAEDFVDLFPVAGDHALLVQVDEVAFDHFSGESSHHGSLDVLVLRVDHL